MNQQNYMERLEDMVVLNLETTGFENLTDKQKMLCMYLSEAGMWGRYIAFEQTSKHNIPLINNLLSLNKQVEDGSKLQKEIKNTLFKIFVHGGIYHHTSGNLLKFALQEETLQEAQSYAPETVAAIKNVLFNPEIPQWCTVQKSGEDCVATSGSNFYENLTDAEVKTFVEQNYPIPQKVQREDFATDGEYNEACKIAEQVPPYGFNDRLVKREIIGEDGTPQTVIERETISYNGLYGEYVKKIVENLDKALEFTENVQQRQAIETLIKTYMTGDPKDFDEHCVDWVKDTESNVYFINGLIESYDDPRGIGCTFESIVSFKNPEATKKVMRISNNMAWFEKNMPFPDEFKNPEPKGSTASSINVISMAGRTSPTLPLGINLPNSSWIRKQHGSKSVNLANSASSRVAAEKGVREAMYLPEYLPSIEKYGVLMNNLHTDLHEIVGHGSGIQQKDKNADDLGIFYSVIEETRADLAGLYYAPDPKLKELGIIDEDVDQAEATMAFYVTYLSNGAFAQLRRFNRDLKELTQPHARNRQLISLWLLDQPGNALELIKKDGDIYLKINDVQKVRENIGKLFSIIQTIKSTADFSAAEQLVMQYGTKVNQDHLNNVKDRIEKLDIPSIQAFNTPIITIDEDGIHLSQSTNFLEQQIQLHEKYCPPKMSNKPKI